MTRKVGTLLFVVLLATNAFAEAKWGGIARQISMGGSNAGTNLVLNPFIMEDPALMLLNPAYQSMYKDYAWMNIGGGTIYNSSGSLTDEGYGHQNSGVAFALNREFALGVILSYDPSTINAFTSQNSVVQLLPRQSSIPPVNNVWEIVGSYDAGSVDFGVGITYGWSNSDVTIDSAGGGTFQAEQSATMFGARVGMIYDMGAGSSFDASVAFRMNNATDNATNFGEYSADGTELMAAARAKLRASNKVNFVPYAMFAMASAEPTEDTPPTGSTASTNSLKIDATAFAVGVGGEYRTADIYLAGGISWQNASVEVKSKLFGADTTLTATFMGVPVFNVGGEWWFTEWLAGRAGYFRAIGSAKVEQEAPSLGTFEANLSVPHSFVLIGGITPSTFDGIVSLGLGFRFGNFSLDATVSEQALRRGLGLIGASDNMNTFGYLTGSYNFE